MPRTGIAHAMEDSQKLIDELLAKLAELDSKVASYRQEMLDQFHKFSDDLLKDVPEDVSNEVSRVIAESMANYPSLSIPSPGGRDSPATRVTSEEKPPREGRKSPPPILYHTSGIPKMFRDAPPPRSPHDREFEFQGLFTPSYLPLLDSTDRPAKQQRVDQSVTFRRLSPQTGNPPYGSPTLARPVVFDNGDDDEVAVVEMVEEVEAAPDTDKGKEVVRPSPTRELTDVSVCSSVGSASSEHKTRRSALRRSSSSAKGSPRRVRFEFAGTEVLPTASPQPSESVLGTISGLDLNAPGSSSSAIDDSEDHLGLSLSDIEGEEDSVPRPPRISSTEALRRLSRTPSDDGTVWKVVNPESDNTLPQTNGFSTGESEPSTQAKLGGETASSASAPSTATMSTFTQSQTPEQSGSENPHQSAALVNGTQKAFYGLGSPSGDVGSPEEIVVTHVEEEDSEEEQFLAIKSPKKSTSPSGSSPTGKSPTAKSPLANDIGSHILDGAPQPSPSSRDKDEGKEKMPAKQAEEEDLFDFEDPAMGMGGSAVAEKYLEEEEEEASAEDAAAAGKDAPATPLYLYSTSPALEIPKTKTPSPPTHSKPMYESIGSYKGMTLRMSSVVSPKIAEEAAAMGDVKTYVGSVHGRTGIDPADESSYRASFSNAKLPGTPRSFSERLMLEEAMGNDEDDVD